VPRAKRMLRTGAIIAGCVIVGSLIEASFDHLRTLSGSSADRFSWRLQSLLITNTLLALCLPLPLSLGRRFVIGGPSRGRALALHAGGALAFGAIHLTMVALEQRFLLGNPQPLFRWTIYLFSYYLARDVLIYLCVVAGLQLVRHQRELRERELESLRLRASLSEARMAALQAQLQPHFLFNVLNTTAMLVREGRGARAIDVLEELGMLLRAVLTQQPQGDVTLAQELDFAGRYLALERVRFEDRLTVRVECPGGLATRRVPFLLLQPLVENAVRHGVAQRSGEASIDVLAREEGGMLILEVRDSGARGGTQTSPAGTGIGLRNVRARLAERFGDAAAFTLERQAGATVARIALPAAA